MADFVVRIDGIKLTKEAQESISRELQAATMRELAKIDVRGDLFARIPKGIINGIIWRNKAFEGNFDLQVNEVRK